MNYETSPDCVCGGTGSVPFSESSPLAMIPCGACMERFDQTHCNCCEKRLGPVTYPSPLDDRYRICSIRCAQASRSWLVREVGRMEAEVAKMRRALAAIDAATDDAVAAWHASDSKEPLPAWLGMTREEYAEWLSSLGAKGLREGDKTP